MLILGVAATRFAVIDAILGWLLEKLEIKERLAILYRCSMAAMSLPKRRIRRRHNDDKP